MVLSNTPKRGEETTNLILRAYRLIHQYQRFQNICRIDKARVPLLRILHRQMNIMCDVNFTSGDGLFNSNFISFIIQFDPRIRELMILLKCWSKSQGITEKCRISSYSLIMCIIFYLQNLKQPMLRSIRASQKEINGLRTASGIWNFNYSVKMNFTANNTQCTRELLEGFFEFYNNFDYMKCVISVYTGTPILRTDFAEHPELDIYRAEVAKHNLDPLNIENPSIIIQDVCIIIN